VLLVVKSIANGLLASFHRHINIVDHQHTGEFPVFVVVIVVDVFTKGIANILCFHFNEI
jgi:hypothetical protein